MTEVFPLYKQNYFMIIRYAIFLSPTAEFYPQDFFHHLGGFEITANPLPNMIPCLNPKAIRINSGGRILQSGIISIRFKAKIRFYFSM